MNCGRMGIEDLVVDKKRWMLVLYCRSCKVVIGEIHKRRRPDDYIKPYLCRCKSFFDVTVKEIVLYINLNVLKKSKLKW